MPNQSWQPTPGFRRVCFLIAVGPERLHSAFGIYTQTVYIMRGAVIQAIGLLIALNLLGAGVTESTFIRQEGIYSPEPTASFRVSADASGLLKCTVEFVLREAGKTGKTSRFTDKLSLDIRRGDKFLGYWDRTNQTFWIATSKEIISVSRSGTTNYASSYHDYSVKTLERTPAAFRKEAEQVFKSP